MMILRSAPASPFGRKVKIAADLLGLHDEIEVVFADTNDPGNSLREQNPLGKIPVLILADGTKLYDSRVIVEYLDAQAGGYRLIPVEPAARWRVLTAAALADGINDAALLQVYEKRFRPPELWSQAWMDRQAEKITRGLAAFAAAPPSGRARHRPYRTCLRARLSRFAFCGRLAGRASRACRLARRFRGRCAGLRGDAGDSLDRGPVPAFCRRRSRSDN